MKKLKNQTNNFFPNESKETNPSYRITNVKIINKQILYILKKKIII